MRITQRAVALTSLQGLNRNLDAVGRLQQQLTSGRLISNPSDSPTGTNLAMQTRKDLEANTQYARNISDAQSWLNQTDSTLQRMLDVTRTVQDRTIQGRNTGSMSDASRQAIATEVAALRETLLGLANTTNQNRPLFGGITTGQTAYDSTTGAFVGLEGAEVIRRVSATETVRVDLTGPEVFGPDGASLFDIVDSIAGHLTDDPSALGQDLDDLAAVMENMLAKLASVGARASRVDREDEITSDQALNLRSRLAETEDIDLPETIMRLQMQQVGYEAALAATAKAITPTLLDYLR
jgi:flagellin-like hook-associated protein FlgL